MMNDSVREELLPKISVSKPLKIEMVDNPPVSIKLNLPAAVVKDKAIHPPSVSAAPPKHITAELTAPKPPISEPVVQKAATPTLVEFHSRNSSVPEWRLQLQNVVRQRHDRENPQPEKTIAAAAPRKTKFATSGANALKAEIIEDKKPARAKNPTLNSALERIEKSRQKFLVEEVEQLAAPVAAPRPANKNFPFYIASKQSETNAKIGEQNAPVNVAAKPKLAISPPADSRDLDTNKLPPLPPTAVKIPSTLEKIQTIAPKVELKIEEKPKTEVKSKLEIKPPEVEEIAVAESENHEDFDECAPVGMRFNAGFFDLIIGGFASLIVLLPFLLTSGSLFTFTGLLTFLATFSVVMFIYLSTTIGFYGRTFGMRIFSLEVVDIEGEHYPTLHQAAVSSAVYLVSLALGGIGFLTLPFNEEKRAVHDLVSGTIVVKEG